MRHFLYSGLHKKYHLALASNDKEALRAMRKSPPDLVLTDWRMPEMGGLRLRQSIRGDDTLLSLPVVILTGSASQDEKNIGYTSFADDHLTKPFDMDDLLLWLNAILKVRFNHHANENVV